MLLRRSLALLLLGIAPVRGQERADLALIPVPQRITRQDGSWTPGAKVQIHIADAEDAFAANQLADELTVLLSNRPQLNGGMEAAIRLQRWGADPVWEAAWGDSAAQALGDEGYVLEVNDQGVRLSAKTGQGVFYGVQTLRQLIRSEKGKVPFVRIADWPVLRYRGWQDDISRGPIPTLDFLKEQVRVLSEYKLNWMTLYTEHVFRLQSHPDIAPADGITAQEIAELQTYAKDFHVEVVGNFQSFGHFTHILKLPAYRHLRETPHVISPAIEESYAFLGDAFGEVAKAYESPLFNINCDETFGLGTGPARSMLNRMGKAGLYAYHIRRVLDLFAPYGKRLMMWGDIARDYPDIIPQLPKDLIALPWAYHAAASFTREIRPFTRLGFDFMVCPGVSCWRRLWPDFGTAIANIAHFVRDGAAAGAMGMLNTTWDDDGENLFHYHWLPLVWGADMAWKPLASSDQTVPEARLAAFKAAFGPVFYELPGSTVADLLFALSDLRRFDAAGNLDDTAFWAPLIAEDRPQAADAEALIQTAKGYAGAFEALAGIPNRHAASLRAAAFAARRVAVQGRLAALRAAIWGQGHGRPVPDLSALEAEIDSLAASVRSLQSDYAEAWRREARPWWLDQILAKHEGLIHSLEGLKGFVEIAPDDNALGRRRTVTLIPLFEAEAVRYTIDGSEVGSDSPLYQGPFVLTGDAWVRVRVQKEDALLPEVSKTIEVYSGPVQSLFLTTAPNKAYPAKGIASLVDGVRGEAEFRGSNAWMGFWGTDFEATLDLGRKRTIFGLGLGCLQDSRSWIHYPQWVRFEESDDGVHYTEIARPDNTLPVDSDGTERHDFLVDSLHVQARFIRITAKNLGKLPDWHKSAGEPPWIFVDEILIRQE